MSQAVSLHIGLNHVDPACYDGWDGELAGCINDANDMEAICAGRGFSTSKLIDADATSSEVIRRIGEIAQNCVSGDLFVLTYSGHGAQVRDVDGDEPDAQDETWVLWDRMLVDDELHSLWCQFQPGVRIFLLSDSCHSGTVARMMSYPKMVQEAREVHAATIRARGTRAPVPTRFRLMPPDVNARTVVLAQSDYDARQWTAGAKMRSPGATVILISGCMDNQLSSDGARNGLFTENVLRVWDNGAFSGGHEAFWRAIQAQMPSIQTPNYFLTGAANPTFEAETPFTLGASAPSPSTPATPPTSSTPPSGRPTIRRGASGGHVTYLQNRLVAHGYPVTVDGDFGAGTEAKVRDFQRDRGLFADGVVGPQSWAALDAAPSGTPGSTPSTGTGTPVMTPPTQPTTPPSSTTPTQPSGSGSHKTLRRGDRGDEVKALQRLLLDLGYVLTADGDFGPGTESRVRAFQSSNGLTSDGIVGQATWSALETQAGTRSTPVGTGTGTGCE